MNRKDDFPNVPVSGLARYAFHDDQTLGRCCPEPPHPYREPFQRDRDRIIHCAAFRRLSEKMQVFTAEFGNYHRNRLTHTMEVVGIARTLGRALALNEDLIEAAALLHDIGHPPFGHAGEVALDQLLTDHGGFEHNDQALRIVEKLERRYIGVPGLNLSKEILEGQAFKFRKARGMFSGTPMLEIQIVDVADSVAYDTHDVDDAMEIGLLDTEQMIQTSLWKRSAVRVRQRWTDLDETEFRRAVVHDLISTQVDDLLHTTRLRIRAANLGSFQDAMDMEPLVRPSAEIAAQKAEIESFLMDRVYRHPGIMLHRSRIVEWLEAIYEYYTKEPTALPKRYEAILRQEGPSRAVADFIADQTDRIARMEAYRLSDTSKSNH